MEERKPDESGGSNNFEPDNLGESDSDRIAEEHTADYIDPEALQLRAKVSQDRAGRFYDRIRNSIARSLERNSPKLERYKEFLFFVPDIFILLWRLTTDGRVSAKNKMLLGSGIAYYIFPLDVMPEMLLGPVGFLDDLVFAAYILNKVLQDTDEQILREHWSGKDNVLDVIKRVLDSADRLVSTDFVNQIKRFVK